ncbi:hypothetical protein [Radiobacillus deserti]|uniref:Uncharacterized protein n=1 Tax=Radiobacillus deserti TaxID=2594883 RepID=A0A516KDJ6_9BACI|nr:hypothetical protein [Radiobacillus deserti]QDP39437.1 hypothetical protein FN924_04150 [Radiobacillus deserti]
MANQFRWGTSKVTEKDYFSTSFLVSRPAPKITEDHALTISAVKSSIELITSSIAQLPISLFRR